MKKSVLVSVLMGFSLSWSLGAQADGPVCSDVHRNIEIKDLDRFSQTVLKIQNGKKQDTTSLRQEVKYVVATEDLQKKLAELQAVFGKSMKNRDQAPDGFFNITSTMYLTVAKYKTLKGDERSAKVRFRKYYTREAPDTAWKNLIVSESLKDKSWLELKIQHPDYANVVTKPRLLCLDRDIKHFVTDSFFQHKEQLRERLLQLNPGKEEEVENALAFMTELYSNPRRRVENLYAKTEYERVSWSIKLPHATRSKETIDVQITLDENVRLTRLADKAKFNVYGSDETVIEVKVPVAYSALSDKDIEQYPGLAEVKTLIQWLDQSHNLKYPKNKGKMSKIEKKGIDRDDPENSRHFEDIVDALGD